jgi:hypothetical protein
MGLCGRNAFRQLKQRHVPAGCKYLLLATPSAGLRHVPGADRC